MSGFKGLQKELRSIGAVADHARFTGSDRAALLGRTLHAQLEVLHDYLESEDLRLEDLVTILSVVSAAEQRVTTLLANQKRDEVAA